MASIGAQVDAGLASSRAAAALEQANRARITNIFEMWERGEITNRQIRFRLEHVVRTAYRATSVVAREHTRRAAELPGWRPENRTFNTDYLDNLRADVRRNLREYGAVRGRKSSTPVDVDKARRRALSRIQHSAGVATTRGYVDALIEAHVELEELGYRLVKVWMANFINNVPCPHCRALHGAQVVGLRSPFKTFAVGGKFLKVYRELQGPPRHPRCKCNLVILILTAETAFTPIDVVDPPAPKKESSASAVRNLPFAVFTAIIAALRALIRFTTGR